MSVSLQPYRDALAAAPLVRHWGEVERVCGLAIDVRGLQAHLGDLCAILPPPGAGPSGVLSAEVVAVRPDGCTLMPHGSLEGLRAGCEVERAAGSADVPVGDAWLGRVLDPFGQPLDGRPAPSASLRRPLRGRPLNPLQRPPVDRILETGVRAIDLLLTLGRGQRVGIFAGSGVGKSTLLGMIARHVRADVNVIALIGERGREVREFLERQLGEEGLARSVVVVAASDQPALVRLRAAHAALAMAEHFRDQGRHVVLTMDSVTRFAMARREVGLAAGEPPTARGYTPSVFAELPALCERCGTAPSGGSITALMTVLVEGDDMNEPVADALRAILDGHIVLSRQLAQARQYPAIDIAQSASRVMGAVAPLPWQTLAASVARCLAMLERARPLVEIGAYQPGANRALDDALAREPSLRAWLAQAQGGADPGAAWTALQDIMADGVQPGDGASQGDTA